MKSADEYEYIATSRIGFVQQVVQNYVRYGYVYHKSFEIPEGKDPRVIDERILNKYDIRKTDAQRYYNKNVLKQGNIQYIRFGNSALLLGTKGPHKWKDKDPRVGEGRDILDCSRGEPIYFQGYSIYYQRGQHVPYRCKKNKQGPKEKDTGMRVRVQICREAYRELKWDFLELARKRRDDWLAGKFMRVPFEPYGPVFKQLNEIRFAVNQKRKRMGAKANICVKVLRTHQHKVKPFAPVEEQAIFQQRPYLLLPYEGPIGERRKQKAAA